MKTISVGAELFHADRQTDGHDEANSRFLKFWESTYKRSVPVFNISQVLTFSTQQSKAHLNC